MFRHKWLSCAFSGLVSLFVFCGGGADIGNPELKMEITGVVRNPDGLRSSDAEVILGFYSTDTLCDSVLKQINGFNVKIVMKNFDTVRCSKDGSFSFKEKPEGRYVLIAQKHEWKGIETITALEGMDSLDIRIDDSAQLSIEPHSVYDESKVHFKKARIAGTPYEIDADSNGKFVFKALPAGTYDIVLFKSTNEKALFSSFCVAPGGTASIIVDPMLAPRDWLVKSSYHDQYWRPFVLQCKVNTDPYKPYDISVQFSHDMDTWKTGKAIQITSSEGSLTIDSLWWESSETVYLRLCASDTAGVCSRSNLIETGKWTLTVDTMAESKYGLTFIWPEVIQLNISDSLKD